MIALTSETEIPLIVGIEGAIAEIVSITLADTNVEMIELIIKEKGDIVMTTKKVTTTANGPMEKTVHKLFSSLTRCEET